MPISQSFLQTQITSTEAQILAYTDAIAFLDSNMTQSYTLDTGQSRQVVTRYDLASIQKQLDSLYNRLATLCARMNGSGVITVRPGW